MREAQNVRHEIAWLKRGGKVSDNVGVGEEDVNEGLGFRVGEEGVVGRWKCAVGLESRAFN